MTGCGSGAIRREAVQGMGGLRMERFSEGSVEKPKSRLHNLCPEEHPGAEVPMLVTIPTCCAVPLEAHDRLLKVGALLSQHEVLPFPHRRRN